MTIALKCEELTGGYADVPAVRDLNLEVEAGEVVTILGPNGAGKTTTMLTIAGVLHPIGGRVNVFGTPVKHGRPDVQARNGLALVPDDRALFFSLTGRENLRLAYPKRSVNESVRLATEYFPALEGHLGRPAGLLSGGQQQMLAIARALIRSPKVLLVDELSMGLAPIVVQAILPVVRRAAKEDGVAVMLVEQHVDLALKVSDRAYVLSHGEMVASASAEELANRRDVIEAGYMGQVAEDTKEVKQ
jgi:branched-chain amino acid transport system ATP-binding protein